MNIVLWVIQVVLAVFFGAAGLGKVLQPKDKLAARMAWVEDFSPASIRLIGVLEVLGAVGLILPGVTGILPILTPLAAVGLALTMAGAAYTHFRRNETSLAIGNIVLLVLAGFVAYGRFVLLPL